MVDRASCFENFTSQIFGILKLLTTSTLSRSLSKSSSDNEEMTVSSSTKLFRFPLCGLLGVSLVTDLFSVSLKSTLELSKKPGQEGRFFLLLADLLTAIWNTK